MTPRPPRTGALNATRPSPNRTRRYSPIPTPASTPPPSSDRSRHSPPSYSRSPPARQDPHRKPPSSGHPQMRQRIRLRGHLDTRQQDPFTQSLRRFVVTNDRRPTLG